MLFNGFNRLKYFVLNQILFFVFANQCFKWYRPRTALACTLREYRNVAIRSHISWHINRMTKLAHNFYNTELAKIIINCNCFGDHFNINTKKETKIKVALDLV